MLPFEKHLSEERKNEKQHFVKGIFTHKSTSDNSRYFKWLPFLPPLHIYRERDSRNVKVLSPKLALGARIWVWTLSLHIGQLKWTTRGAWVAQSVKHPTSTQVTISWSGSSSPASGSGLMAQNLEPVSHSVSPSLCPSPVHALSLSVPKINKR